MAIIEVKELFYIIRRGKISRVLLDANFAGLGMYKIIIEVNICIPCRNCSEN